MRRNLLLIVDLLVIASQLAQSTSSTIGDSESTDTDPPSPDAEQVYIEQPKSLSFVTARVNAEISCKARKAISLEVQCLDRLITQRRQEEVEGQGDSLTRTVSVQITRNQVEEIGAEYDCVCLAKLEGQGRLVKSKTGRVRKAYMTRNFADSPIDISVEYLTEGRLACRPPDSQPRPTVYWEKNGKRLDVQSNANLIITSDGDLLVNQATLSDEGNYTCYATNTFFTRSAESARLFVHVNGVWSIWSHWSSCDTECGSGEQERQRSCDNPPPSGGSGRYCEGESTQTSPCTRECPPVDGKWAAWGSWSQCNSCQKHRFRECTNPPPNGTGRSCPGSDVQTSNCTESLSCNGGTSLQAVESAKPKDDSQSIVLWVVLCAAVVVFAVILVVIIMCLMRRKNQRNAMFEMERTNADSSNSDVEKFPSTHSGHIIQPDLTKSMPLSHARVYRQNSAADAPEKMSMLQTNHFPAQRGRDYYMQISPGNHSSDNHEYMQIGQNDESSEDKVSQQSSSPESGICNSSDRQSLLSSQLPNSIDNDALSWGNVTHTGGRLTVLDSGITITIPEGAVSRNQSEELFIAALREEKDRPILLDKQTLLSPVILCGPQATTFNKSLILSFDHCASLKLGQWKLSIYCSHSGYDEQVQWERLMTLNQEILHAPVFCQMDNSLCHVMVDQLAARYCLVGESMYGSKGVKHLRLAAFATPFSGCLEYNVRVYVLPDTQDALHSVAQQENKLGSKLMDKPKQISFQDGGNSLCLMIDSIGPGWISKLPAQYQEIPFRHVWHGHTNLHCSFSFERANGQPSQTTLSCKIQVYQKSVLSNRQTINVSSNIEASFKLIGQKDLSSTVTVNTQSSSGCSSMITLDHPSQQIFKLPTSLKKRLASHLDMPCIRGNDWRMLAAALNSDRQLNFFASKPSPTEAILDLWEARSSSEELSTVELTNILRVMGRQDAVNILEREMQANAWV